MNHFLVGRMILSTFMKSVGFQCANILVHICNLTCLCGFREHTPTRVLVALRVCKKIFEENFWNLARCRIGRAAP